MVQAYCPSCKQSVGAAKNKDGYPIRAVIKFYILMPEKIFLKKKKIQTSDADVFQCPFCNTLFIYFLSKE